MSMCLQNGGCRLRYDLSDELARAQMSISSGRNNVAEMPSGTSRQAQDPVTDT